MLEDNEISKYPDSPNINTIEKDFFLFQFTYIYNNIVEI